MPNPGIDFSSADSIRNWAIQLANACGGSQILFGKIKPANFNKANALLEEFAQAYNTRYMEVYQPNIEGEEHANSGEEE